MTMAAPLELRIGDRLRLRKEHPCGSRDWAVVRLGAEDEWARRGTIQPCL